METKLKRTNGITLIALIITIIVLLILAGVALATLTGQGNIIGNAENAVGKYNNSLTGEQQLLNEIEKYFIEHTNGDDNIPKVDENGLAKENVTITTDEENVQIVIPKGFAPAILNESNSTYSEPGQDGSVKEIMPYEEWFNITADQINNGIVIVDHAITYDNGKETGKVPDFNEFVWVPITDSSKFTTIKWEGKSAADTTFWDEETTEYNNMVNSVLNNKGFYIGRYEASNDGNDIAQSKRNQDVWVAASFEIANSASENNVIANTHLIYGIEWDSTLNWLIGNAIISSSTDNTTKTIDIDDIQNDSSSWGNFSASTGDALVDSGEEQTTGYSEYWKANNIYDIAGNVWEWTKEECSVGGQYRIIRGGFYYYNGDRYPVAYREAMDKMATDPYQRIPC